MDNKNTSLYNTINKLINTKLSSLYTVLPGIIISYDSNTNTCSVRPSIKKRFRDNAVVSQPILNNVPVLLFQTSTSIISTPLVKGDTVLIVFCQRSLDEWKNKDGEVLPEDSRKFDINDAIVLPGFLRKGVGLKPSKDGLYLQKDKAILLLMGQDICIQNDKLQVLFSEGTLSIKNTNNELISVLNDLCTELKNFATEISNITTMVMGAPVPPTNLSALMLYISKFNDIINKISTFKK